MAYQNSSEFIAELEQSGDLVRVAVEVDPELEITEIANRAMKSEAGGKALLFENVKGSKLPLLINALGSKARMCRALGVEDIFNPKQNISGGVRYFKQLVNQFNGDVKLALAAYNAGSRNVRNYQGVPPFKATRYYIKKVFKYYQIYKNQMAYNEKGIVSLNDSNQLS